MDFKRIYTSDYSSIGYQEGVKAAEQGKPKSYFGALRMNPINYIWGFNDAINSYNEYYTRGYDAGLRVHENIYHTNLQNSGTAAASTQADSIKKTDADQANTSPAANSPSAKAPATPINDSTQGGTGKISTYRDAITALQTTKSGIESNIKSLEMALQIYQRQVKAATSAAGFVEDYTVPLNQQLKDTATDQKAMVSEMKRIVTAIEEAIDDLEYLRSENKE